MTAVELLQQLGLNKYEAEAYYTLLARGALTGYEVGKYSHVPLSRSYEILERLTQKGLALVQPGDPPHYSAQDPRQFLSHFRSTMEATLSVLTTSLVSLARPTENGEFWVIRGREPILARAQTIIAQANTLLALTVPVDCQAALAPALLQTQERGCQIYQYSITEQSMLAPEMILLLCDDHEALAGMVTSGDACQATVSSNAALLTALHGYFAHQRLTKVATPIPTPSHEDDWLAWEEGKQRRLWHAIRRNRVA